MSKTGARIVAWLACMVAAAAGVGAVAACIDLTPTYLAADDASQPPASDAGPDAGDAGDPALDACISCLRTPDKPGPGCADEFGACNANTECSQAVACAIANRCFAQGSLYRLEKCAIPCADEAGIKAVDDPAGQLGLALFKCLAGACGPACGIEGGAGH